ncbi:N-acetylmuramidase domain-containing protein [Pseudomonas helleri]|uniref:N-acetylmuramidase domain-containing protein n=1 Tax=Pseudomonas helleri TaxID=1608996 RepID=UPI001294FE4B|nr:N-acetylmuramidase family protein [Pseudomonas helleri]MQT34877.1 DUF3380 domain-containing protein [Pseudomonas helleri]
MVLKMDSHGSDVAELQRLLNKHGAKISVDGWFGTSTQAAVIELQREAGLVADGIAGAKTMAFLVGKPSTRVLREKDLQAAADRLELPLISIKTVNSVESNGSGFLFDGRPVILFERHVFYQRLKAKGADVESLAARFPNLCNQKRGGYTGGAGEWARLRNARLIIGDAFADIAYEACSWGLFQIMGYHWENLGYGSAAQFVDKMSESEGGQLDAFVSFIASDAALHKALKARKWADFAKLYNGPAYKENLYDAKLAQAYERFERLAA